MKTLAAALALPFMAIGFILGATVEPLVYGFQSGRERVEDFIEAYGQRHEAKRGAPGQ